MSGIAGIVTLDGSRADKEDLERIARAMPARGVDGVSFWMDDGVGLAHLLMRTSRAPAEPQPSEDAQGQFVAVLHGQIHEVRGLERAGGQGALQATTPPLGDTQLLLTAFARFGDATPDHIYGDFAFAVWDRVARKLTLARDIMGVRPLAYYHAPGRFFAFATHPRALLALGIQPKLDEITVIDHLAWNRGDASRTMWEGVRRLPPAHTAIVANAGLRVERYWDAWAIPVDRQMPAATAAAGLRATLERAVRDRLVGADPIGAELSGGLDSTSVAFLARRALPEDVPIHTFSLTFDVHKECDEREYIHAALAEGTFTPHFVQGDRTGPLDELREIQEAIGCPSSLPNLYLHWEMYRAAKSAGVSVMLNGFDGDNVVGHGYQRLGELARSGRFFSLAKEVRAIARARGGRVRGVLAGPVLATAWPAASRAFQRARGNPSREAGSISLLAPQYQGLAHKRSRELEPWVFKRVVTDGDEHRWRLSWAIIAEVLEGIEHAGAEFGVEPRCPYFDRRVIEHCLRVPAQHKLFDGVSRVYQREAMRGIMPEKVRTRPGKGDLSTAFYEGILNRGRIQVQRVISMSQPQLQAYSPAYAEPLKWTQDRAFMLWRAVTLGAWLSTHDPAGVPASAAPPSGQTKRS